MKLLRINNIEDKNTTKIIDSLLFGKNDGDFYDTLILEDAFALQLEQKMIYVHLYVKKDVYNTQSENCGITFTEYKKQISHFVFTPFSKHMHPIAEIALMSLSDCNKKLSQDIFDFEKEFCEKPILFAQDSHCHNHGKYGETYTLYFIGARFTSKPLNDYSNYAHLGGKGFKPNNITTINDVADVSKTDIVKRFNKENVDTLFIKNSFILKLSQRKKIYVSIYAKLDPSNVWDATEHVFEDCKIILFNQTFDVNKALYPIPKSAYRLLINPKINLSEKNLDWICEAWDKQNIVLDRKKGTQLTIHAYRFTKERL